MASFNKVILIGNLTRDVDCRTTGNGTIIAELGLAVNRRWRDQSGRDQEEVCFVDVTVWGKSAENCAQYLQKGSQVMVEGRLKLDTWEDRNDGGKRSKLTVVAENVVFLSRSNDGAGQDSGSGGNGGGRQNAGGDRPQRGDDPQRGRDSRNDGGSRGRNDGGFSDPPTPGQPYRPQGVSGNEDDSDIPF